MRRKQPQTFSNRFIIKNGVSERKKVLLRKRVSKRKKVELVHAGEFHLILI